MNRFIRKEIGLNGAAAVANSTGRATAAPSGIQCVGVITCNRPKQLKRCLLSYITDQQKYAREYELIVADDSDDALLRRSCRQWLHDFGQRFRLRISYVGREERSRFIRRLVATGITPELARFALTNPLRIPSSPGANRNALLLHSIGNLVLSCDDDSVCRIGDLRHGDQSIRLVPFGNANLDTHFVDTCQAAVESVPPASCDLLAAHEELLGRPLSGLLPSSETMLASHSLPFSGKALSDLIEGKGRVKITLSGVYGDSGIPNPLGFMFARGATRERFLAQWNPLRGSEAPRNVIRGVSRPAIAPVAEVITTTATGLDNTMGLLPFLPSSGKGEDTLFGLMAQKCFPDIYTGYVPLVLLHDPERNRKYKPLPTRFGVVDAIIIFLNGYPSSVRLSGKEPLISLGRYFVECGRAAPDDFKAYLLTAARRRAATYIERCMWYLHEFNSEPVYWADVMRHWIGQLDLQMRSSDVGVLADVPKEKDNPDRYATAQSFISAFGELLQTWPDLVDATLCLRNSGCKIAEPVSE